MSDRSWNPQAMRSFADFQKRQAKTDGRLGLLLPPPPPPLPLPPAPPELTGFKVQAGACRDRSGGYGRSPRIEGPGKAAARVVFATLAASFVELRVIDRAVRTGLHFSDLVAKCVALGSRCDALDINGHPPKPGSDPPIGCTASTGSALSVFPTECLS